MEFVIILLGLLILAILLNINTNKIKYIVEDTSLRSISGKLPENKKICEDILKIIENDDVIIEEQNNYKNSLYIVLRNKIILGKMKIDSLKVQTIAHECAHSIQNRKILIFNFIFTNIYYLYFYIILILTIFGIIENKELQLYILTILTVIQSTIRNYLETNAMTKAEFIAEKYLNTTDLKEEEVDKLMRQYKNVNDIGIPLVNYITIAKDMLKLLVYSIFLVI